MVDKWRGREQLYISACARGHRLTLETGSTDSTKNITRRRRSTSGLRSMLTWFPFGCSQFLCRHHQRPVENKTTHDVDAPCQLLTFWGMWTGPRDRSQIEMDCKFPISESLYITLFVCVCVCVYCYCHNSQILPVLVHRTTASSGRSNSIQGYSAE
jgi:hypothetical protein